MVCFKAQRGRYAACEANKFETLSLSDGTHSSRELGMITNSISNITATWRSKAFSIQVLSDFRKVGINKPSKAF